MADLALTARLNTSAADTRRGVVRLHPEALAALGLREWDPIALTGGRRTAAVVGIAPAATPAGVALLDDVTLSNCGVKENATVVIAPATVYGARQVQVSGSVLATQSIPADTLRQALLGKVVSVGDAVSLLPRDLGPGTSTAAASQALSRTFGVAWTSELLTVTEVEPAGPVSVQPNTAVGWGSGTARRPAPPDLSIPAAAPEPVAVPLDDLVGVGPQVAKLREWLSLALDEPELLERLGAPARLGVLVSGPAGVGKATLARSVLADRRVVALDGPTVGATEAGSRLRAVSEAVASVASGGVLLVSDIDALLPAEPEPVATLIIEQLRAAVATRGVAFVATTAHPDGLDARLRDPELCDRELTVGLPDGAKRRALLEALLRKVPTKDLALDEIAVRAPGFVVADLAALCREAALRAAARASRENSEPVLLQEDLLGALEVIRPLSRSGAEELAIGSVNSRRRRRHGRDQAGAHRGRAVAATPPRLVRPPRRRPPARRAALRPARLRQDVPGPGAREHRTAVGACGEGRGTDGQVGRCVGEGGAGIVRPGAAIRRRRWCSSTRSMHWRRGAGRAPTRVSAIGWSPPC